MSTPTLPVLKRGASILVFNALAYYFDQSGARIRTARGTEQTMDDFFGRLGESSHGGQVAEIDLTPTGQIKSLAKIYPYGPATIEGVTRDWYGGQSIYNGAGYFNARAGTEKKSLYAKMGIFKSPTMTISPRKQIFGPMTFRAVNKIAGPTLPTAADAFKTITDTAFADATFDETTIVKEIPTVTLGEGSAMGARTGVEIEPVYEITVVDDDNVGEYEATVDSVSWRCRMAANNLTEAQFDTLCGWQGADARIAGQDVSFLDEDLVIDSDFLTVTLHKVGVVRAENGWGVKIDRNGMIEFVNRMTFTASVPDPLITMAIN